MAEELREGDPRSARIRYAVAWGLTLCLVVYALRPQAALLTLACIAVVQVAWILALRRRVLLRRLAIVALSATLALLLGELVAGRLWPISPDRILPYADSPAQDPYLPDPELGTVQAPNFRGYFMHPDYERELFETGADGFRGAAWDSPLPGVGARVLILGDSTAVGFGVVEADTISAQLENRLTGEGHVARVFNAAVAGYGPRHERILLDRLAERVRPTHVIAIFYDGNDLPNCRAQFVHARNNGLHALRLPSEGPGPDPVHVPSRPPSMLSRWYWSHRSALYYRIETALMPWLVSHGWLRHHAYGGILRVTQREPAADVREEFDLAVEAFAALKARCDELDADFLLVRMPMRVQTEVESFAALLDVYGVDATQHERELPGKALLEKCDERGIRTLDLLAHFEVPGKGPNEHYFIEGHPNRRGNRATADLIAERWIELESR